MRFELISGDTTLLSILCNDGWELINTFQNPYPEPYFFALMRLNATDEKSYDLKAAEQKAENQKYPKGVPF